LGRFVYEQTHLFTGQAQASLFALDRQNRRRDEVPPIAVVMAQPDLPWDFKHLLQQWPLASILALAPDPHWLDWDEVSIRGAADFSLVLAHVSSRRTPSQLEAHVSSTSLIACGTGEF
jgi:hypothetical protein